MKKYKLLIIFLIPVAGIALMFIGAKIAYSVDVYHGQISIPGQLQITISEAPAKIRIAEVMGDHIDKGFKDLEIKIQDKANNSIPVDLKMTKDMFLDEDDPEPAENEYKDIYFAAEIITPGTYSISTNSNNPNIKAMKLYVKSMKKSNLYVCATLMLIGFLSLIIGSVVFVVFGYLAFLKRIQTCIPCRTLQNKQDNKKSTREDNY